MITGCITVLSIGATNTTKAVWDTETKQLEQSNKTLYQFRVCETGEDFFIEVPIESPSAYLPGKYFILVPCAAPMEPQNG